MPARIAFDYAIVRVVPRVEREEFVNVGVIVHAPAAGYLDCAFALDVARLRALAPELGDAWLADVRRHLDAFAAVCAGVPGGGPIAALPAAERFRWLVAPRSTVVQVSPVHGGLAGDPAGALAELLARRVG